MLKRPKISTIAFLLSVVISTGNVLAEESELTKVADTSSPRDTLRSFIDACNQIYQTVEKDHYIKRSNPEHQAVAQRIIDCIDTRDLPAYAREQRAGEVAACLKEILDRVELPPWDEIPDADAIEAAGGLENLSRWRIPDTRITIARVEEGPQKHEYLFSRGTVDRAVEYFHQIRSHAYRTDGPATSPGIYDWYIAAPGGPLLGAIVKRLPDRIRFGRTFGMTNWKWPGVIVLTSLAVLAMWYLYYLHWTLSSRFIGKSTFKYCLTIVFPALAMLVPIALEHLARTYLTLRSAPLYLLQFTCEFTAILAAIILVFSACRRIAEAIIASPQIDPQQLNAQLIRISARLLAVVVATILFIYGGQRLGIPIGTLLASAGIGGVAVALGAQDSLKTLFGTIAIMADKPFRVGDRIVIDRYDGFVEDIGLRTTKVRLLAGHIVTLPNDQVANHDVENVTSRSHIRQDGEIFIPLDTKFEKVERAVAILRETLADHEGMEPDYPPRVYLDKIGADAFRISFTFWYAPPSYWDFKAFNDKLHFEIFRTFEMNNISFSLPLRHSYWKHDAQQGPLEITLLGEKPSPSDEVPDAQRPG